MSEKQPCLACWTESKLGLLWRALLASPDAPRNTLGSRSIEIFSKANYVTFSSFANDANPPSLERVSALAAQLAATQWRVLDDPAAYSDEHSVIDTGPGRPQPNARHLPKISLLVYALCTDSLKLHSRGDTQYPFFTRLKAFERLQVSELLSGPETPLARASLLWRCMAGHLREGENSIIQRLMPNARAYVVGAEPRGYWLSDCHGDQMVLGIIALACAVDVRASAQDRTESRKWLDSRSSDPDRTSATSRVFKTALDELETLRREWEERTDGWRHAYAKAATSLQPLILRIPNEDVMQRSISVTVAAELFENCCRRQNTRFDELNICENLVIATMLSRQF